MQHSEILEVIRHTTIVFSKSTSRNTIGSLLFADNGVTIIKVVLLLVDWLYACRHKDDLIRLRNIQYQSCISAIEYK